MSRRRGAGEQPGVRWLAVPDTARMRAPTPRIHGVRYPPLGSPWSTPECLLAVSPRGAVREGCTTQRCGGGVPGRVVYRVLPTTLPGTRTLVLPGPNRWPIPALPCPWALRGPPGPLRTPSSRTLRYALLEPIKARFSSIYPKVSHKTGVSPKNSDEAWHSPCFKNRPRKSRP